MASQADIIFFLGDARKPLTQSEIASLKDLIKVSNSKQIIHLLTCSDLKNTDEISASNKKMFETDFSEYAIPIIKVSSLSYRKYIRSGKREQLDVSGFLQVKSIVAELNSDLKSLLNIRFNTLALDICKRGHVLLSEVIETVENPELRERKVEELKDLVARLTEIEENQSVWQQELNGELQKFVSDLNSFINKQQDNIVENVRENLKNDSYLEDKDALGKSITADLIRFQNNLDTTITNSFIRIYNWLRITTGLKKIQDESIKTPNSVDVNISIDRSIGNAKFGQKMQGLYRSVLVGGAISTVVGAAGQWAGGAIGAKVGAAIGTGIAPGVGTAIGAAVGAISGVLVGVFTGFSIFKESKEERKRKQRNEILEVCKKQIKDFFANISKEVNRAKIDQSTDLAKQFIREVRTEKKSLQLRKNRMQNEALRVRANFEAIKKLVEDSAAVCANLQKK